jgi:hypothetical protein
LQVSAWMDGRSEGAPAHVTASEGVVWTRDYGGQAGGHPATDAATGSAGSKECLRLGGALSALEGARRLVVGHTPQQQGANSGCGGAVWRIDVGASKGVLGNHEQVPGNREPHAAAPSTQLTCSMQHAAARSHVQQHAATCSSTQPHATHNALRPPISGN